MMPTKSSIKESRKIISTIKELLNQLNHNPNEFIVYQTINTSFNAKGLKLNDDYILLLCSLFGDKLVEYNKNFTPKLIVGEEKNIVDGFDYFFINEKENKRLEISNFGDRAEISFSRCLDTKRWVLDWKEVKFVLEKGKEPMLETTNYNYDTLENDSTLINMNKPIQEITKDVINSVGADFLPLGPIKEKCMKALTKSY